MVTSPSGPRVCPGVACAFAWALAGALAGTASAGPTKPTRHDGAHARVAIGVAGALRSPTGAAPHDRRGAALTPEEATARQIEQLLRGPLRHAVTGIYVADARTGEPLFAVNADDPLNPASNVKMISSATALELLGPDFRYATRVLGAPPDGAGVVHGNVYLLGTWDPTLDAGDFDELADQLAAHGVKQLAGDIEIGGDPTRDGIYHAVVPVEVTAGAPGAAPTAAAPPGFDLLTFQVTAKTARGASRPRLHLAAETVHDPAGHVRVQVTVSGTIGKGRAVRIPLVIDERTQVAAHALRAALRAHGVTVTGDVGVEELGAYLSDATLAGGLPVELARHQSARLADILAHVDKWSINWLADRVIMTAAALARHEAPSMHLALEEMYGWLARHAHIDRADAVIDTGSGLSYHTRISPRELVSVVRSAAGFTKDANPEAAHAWIDSLSISGIDGTLRHRFQGADVRGRIHGKTGSLSTVIALSGVLETDPARPLVFSIVTNGERPIPHRYVRRAHEQIVALITKYLATTDHAVASAPPPPPPPRTTLPADLEQTAPDPALDDETAEPDPAPAVPAAPAKLAAPAALAVPVVQP